MAVKAEIQLVATGAAQVNAEFSKMAGSLQRLETAGRSVSNSLAQIGSIIGVSFGAQGLTTLLRTADAYNVLQGRIADATRTTGDYARVSAQLSAIAAKTGADLSATVSVFQALARTAPELGVTNAKMLELTELVQKLGVLSGATTQGMSAGLLQFSQAMAAGVVRAEEMNSILENIPALAQAIADGMGLTVGELRAAVKEGRVLSEDVLQAVMSQAADVEQRFAAMPVSMERGWSAFKQGLTSALADLDKALGLTNAIGQSLSNWGQYLAAMSTEQARFNRLIAEREQLESVQAKTTAQYNRLIDVRKEIADMSALKEREQRLQSAAEAEAEFMAAVRKSEEAVKAENAAYMKSLETTKKVTTARSGARKAVDELAKAEKKHADEVERTLDALKLQYVELTQGERARYEMELATKGWTEAEREAALALYDQNEALRKTQAELKNAKDETNVYAEVVEDAARGMRSAFSSFFESLLTDGTKAFKNFGDMIKKLFIKLLADLMSAALANPIQILLGVTGSAASGAAAASAGSLATGGAASAGGGLLGNLGTSLLGGITGFSSALYGGLGALGTAALGGAPAGLLGTAGNLLSFGSAGITSGSLAGLASGLGAVASVALPVIGIAAAIAGLAGLFKDKNPDEQWFRLVSGTRYGVDATKAPISSANTAFGAVGISGHEDLAGDGRAFAAQVTETIVAIDQQIAASFTQAQIDAAKAALEGTLSHSPEFGGDASMNADQAVAVALKQRYVMLFAAVDQGMAEQIAAAANSTEAVGAAIQKSALALALRTQIAGLQTQIGDLLEQSLDVPENQDLAGRLMAANQVVADVAQAYDGSLESLQMLAAVINARGQVAVEYLRALRPVQAGITEFTSSTASATPTRGISEQLSASAGWINDIVGAMDYSVHMHEELLRAVQERYQLEVQYLTQIKAISAEISAVFGATAETISTAFFTPQQSYDYYKTNANTAVEQLATATTPEQIQAIIATINAATQQAWQTLGQDTAEAKAKQAEFLTFLTDTETLAQEKLATMEAAAQEENAAIRSTVVDSMASVALSVDNLARATAALTTAANAMGQAAAAMPTTITVEVAEAYA